MSTATRERNANFIAWDAVIAQGVFTLAAPVDWKHELLSASSSFRWCRRPMSEPTPDADIIAGRVHRFDDVESMLASLKE